MLLLNKVTVIINGIEYNLKGEEKEDYLKNLASHVDGKISNLLSQNNRLSTTSASILTALNVTDEFFKMKEEMDRISEELSEEKEKNFKNKEEIEILKKGERELKNSLQDSKRKVITLQNSLIKEQIERLKGTVHKPL